MAPVKKKSHLPISTSREKSISKRMHLKALSPVWNAATEKLSHKLYARNLLNLSMHAPVQNAKVHDCDAKHVMSRSMVKLFLLLAPGRYGKLNSFSTRCN